MAALILVACSTEPAAQNNAQAAANGSEMVCTREYPIGSNIPVTKCRTRGQVDADKAAATQGLSRVQTGGPNAKMGSN